MAHSTKPRPKSEDFPLWQRKDGRWCRKIGGRTFYFGYDREAALTEWLRVKDYRLAGLEPPPKDAPDAVTLEVLVNEYLTSKATDVKAGEFTAKSLQNAFVACEKIVKHFGRHRIVMDIGKNDFAGFRDALVNAGYAPSTVAQHVTHVKTLFRWGHEAELFEKLPKFGEKFKGCKKTSRRQNGKVVTRMFEPPEIKAMIDAAGAQLKAMILLGVNAGYGNFDCAQLPLSAVDLDGGWVTFPRPKTGVARRCALWPETQVALQKAIQDRPEPQNPADANQVFLTTHGNRWVRISAAKADGHQAWQDAIIVVFRNLLKTTGLEVKGRGFYTFRRVFRTVADETGDWPAVNYIMGHADPTIGGIYRQRISDERLRTVTEHVRRWLFGEGGAK
jgi:integrase